MAEEPNEGLQPEEAPEGTEAEQPEVQPEEPQGEDELEVRFGDEAAPASGEGDTGLVKHLREKLREAQQENADLRKRTSPQKIEVGQKPTLAGCDYDEERYEAERDAWETRKRQAEAVESQSQQTDQAVREQWQRDLQSYQDKKAQLRFPDVEDAEAVATAALNEVQQAVIVKAADNPALVLYSLGKHPAKLAELSKITDPLKMAAAVARLEGGLKVMPKRKAPPPEEIETGSAPINRGTDEQLKRLEAEAERTKDRTKLIAYRKDKGLLAA